MIHLHNILPTYVPPGYRWAVHSPTTTICTKTRKEARALAGAMPKARVVRRREALRPGCFRHDPATA